MNSAPSLRSTALRRGIISCLVLIFFPSAAALAQAPLTIPVADKTIDLPGLTGAATIDGRLDDALWAQAAVIEDLHQVFPTDHGPPTERTEIRVFYTEDALYVGARLWESDPSQISDRILRQGQTLGGDDIFAVILDPYLDRRNGYRFEVNANGIRWEGLFQNISEVEGNWDGIWEARSQRNEDGWTTEIRIPFQSLSFNPDSSSWGINFNRIRRRSNESIAWSSRNREINPSVSGTAEGFAGLRQGLGLDVVPSLAVARRRRFGPNGFTENNYEPQLDVFYKLTPQLNASLTINTDFSATEVDDRQVNLTRFNLFFPEKRDFFLRDVDIFEFGQIGWGGFNNVSGTGSAAASNPARQSARPFFSRKIGLAPNGAPIPINAGAKVSGRIGNWNVGTLVVNQDEAFGIEQQNIFVGRTVLNVGARTQIGAIVTDGNPQGNLDNTLIGTDFRYRNTGFYGNTIELNGFYEATETEGRSNDDNAAYAVGVVLPNAQGWQGLYNYKRVGRNFFPAVGYVNVTDIEDHHLQFGYRDFMEPGAFFRSILYTVEGYRADNISNGKLNNQNVGFRWSSFTNTNDSYFARYIKFKELLPTPFTIYRAPDTGRTIVIPAGEYAWNEKFLGLQWGAQRRISGGLNLQGGDYYDGTHFSRRGNVTWRPNRYFAIDFSMTEDRIKLPGGHFTLRLFGINSQIAFSSTLSWSNLVQYDNISENLGFNSRLHWIPKAGQQAFVVLNWGLIDPDRDNVFESTIADLSLKFNYTFRF